MVLRLIGSGTVGLEQIVKTEKHCGVSFIYGINVRTENSFNMPFFHRYLTHSEARCRGDGSSFKQIATLL